MGSRYAVDAATTLATVASGAQAAAMAAATARAASRAKPVGPLCNRLATSKVSWAARRGSPAFNSPIGAIAMAAVVGAMPDASGHRIGDLALVMRLAHDLLRGVPNLQHPAAGGVADCVGSDLVHGQVRMAGGRCRRVAGGTKRHLVDIPAAPRLVELGGQLARRVRQLAHGPG